LVQICLYCLNCTKFGQLILRKINKIIATRCQILKPKYTKFDLGWGSAPDSAGGAYSAPSDPLAGFKGAASRQGGEGEGMEKGRERIGMDGKGRGRGKGKPKAQLMLTNPRDAFRGQSRSPNIAPFLC